jgi:hypothetical protein
VQIYYGVKSKFIAIYPMTTEPQGPQTLEDLCCEKGAPFKTKNDRARMETGNQWTCTSRSELEVDPVFVMDLWKSLVLFIELMYTINPASETRPVNAD